MKRGMAAIAVIVAAMSIAAGAETLLSVHYIDVGHGDATLIDYGVFEALIDGGSDGRCSDYIAPYIDGFIEVLIVTNADPGRIGGLDEVLADYDVAAIYFSPTLAESGADEVFVNAIATEGSFVSQVQSGSRITLGDLPISVLSPSGAADAAGEPVVLRLSYREWDFLFPGTLDSGGEERLIAEGLRRAEILKIGNRGSRDSTSSAFLNAVWPQACVLSVGPDGFGEPDARVLDRIGCAPRNPILFRTDVHGSVVFEVTDEGGVVYRTLSNEPPLSIPCSGSVPESSASAPACDCSSAATLNCEDFPCQPVAQACFEYCLRVTGRDVHGLDADEDGIACEELPTTCP